MWELSGAQFSVQDDELGQLYATLAEATKSYLKSETDG